jgi:signal transduction histidine kinase
LRIRYEQDKYRDLLVGVATDLLSFKDSTRLFEGVFAHISQQMDAELCLAYLRRGDSLEAVFSAGLDPAREAHVRHLPLSELSFDNKLGANRGVAATSTNDATVLTRRLQSSISAGAFCSYPVCAAGRLLGLVCFGTANKSHYDPGELDVFQAIADQVALALDRMTLLQELAQSNQKLLSVNADLRRAHTELEQIAFSASHDLREPVRHLNSYAELLETRLKELTNDSEVERYLQFILSKAKRMELLVADLLEYTGVAHEEPAATLVDPNAILNKVCNRLKNLIEQTGTRIKIEPLPFVYVAEDDLAAIFENLIENAIIHHRSGQFPEVRVYARKTNSAPEICVEDNGLGIDPAYREKIFNLFSQLDSEHRNEATGMGLTLCRKIIRRYDGDIWLESKPGRGASFCFVVRKTASPEQTSVRAAAAQ